MNIDTLRLLVAKGLSAEDILEVAETMDAPAWTGAVALSTKSAAASGWDSPRRERQAAYSVFIRVVSFTTRRLHMVRNFRRIYRGAPLHKPR